MQNLIDSKEHQSVAVEMNKKLFGIFELTGGMYIRLNSDRTLNQQKLRNGEASKAAPFPTTIVK